MDAMQEKFQIIATTPHADKHEWVDFASQRKVVRNEDTVERVPHYNMDKALPAPPSMQMSHLNRMPYGQFFDGDYDIKDEFGKVALAGSTDVTNAVSAEALSQGFTSMRMAPTTDQCTDEHRDDFYDDVGGFVERANYLDRL